MRDRPGAVKDRRIAHRLRRKQTVTAVIRGEGRAQPIAKRALDKTHLRPAGGAKRTWGLPASSETQAGERKHKIGGSAHEGAQARQGTRRDSIKPQKAG